VRALAARELEIVDETGRELVAVEEARARSAIIRIRVTRYASGFVKRELVEGVEASLAVRARGAAAVGAALRETGLVRPEVIPVGANVSGAAVCVGSAGVSVLVIDAAEATRRIDRRTLEPVEAVAVHGTHHRVAVSVVVASAADLTVSADGTDHRVRRRCVRRRRIDGGRVVVVAGVIA
jgi:hypothetical protein